MKNTATIICLAVLSLHTATGQTYKNKVDSLWTAYQTKRGERLFNNMRYLKTTTLYDPIFLKNKLVPNGKSILAQAYLNIAQSEGAEEVLRSMDSSAMPKTDVYNMAQCLKLNAKYDESDVWMDKFERMDNADSRPKWQSNSASEVAKILNRTRYRVDQLPFNSAQSDFGAFPYGDDVVFASARPLVDMLKREYGWKDTPYLNVFKANATNGIAPQIFSPKLKTAYHDGPVSFSADGTEMYVTQNPYRFPGTLNKKEINQFKLFISKKQTDGSWGPLDEMPFNGPGFSTGHAVLSADGRRIWFASDRPGGMGRSDIYYADRTVNGWGEPVNAGTEINTEGDEMFPFEATDGKLYFASNGHLTIGGLDICIAFNTPSGYKVRNMGYPVNSTKDDFGLYLAPDLKSGYFASNRPGGIGDDDIYAFTVLDPIVLNRELRLLVKDKSTGQPMPSTDVQIAAGNVKKTLKTNNDGLLSFQTDNADQLTASTQPLGYRPALDNFALANEVTQVELLVDPLPVWGVYGHITNLKSGTGIDSVTVTIQPVGQSSSIGNTTLNGGDFRNQVEPETDYSVMLSHPQFFTKRGTFTTKGRPAGWINVNEFMETAIEQVEMNKVIEIPNIYYDLGKWAIRKDAAVELNKVVTFMNDNPNISIELGSHTDSRGNAASNQTLSQKRAQSAVDYIVTKGGVARERIAAKGYGESMLKNQCADGVTCSEAEHQQNRRTEIRITGVK